VCYGAFVFYGMILLVTGSGNFPHIKRRWVMPNTEQQEPLGSAREKVVQDLVARFDLSFAAHATEQVLGKLPGRHHPHKAQWFERHRIGCAAAERTIEDGGSR
jgi:hypothetical protein